MYLIFRPSAMTECPVWIDGVRIPAFYPVICVKNKRHHPNFYKGAQTNICYGMWLDTECVCLTGLPAVHIWLQLKVSALWSAQLKLSAGYSHRRGLVSSKNVQNYTKLQQLVFLIYKRSESLIKGKS